MANRKARTFREVFSQLLDTPIDYNTACEISEIFSRMPPDTKNAEAIAMAQIYKAMKGDTAAAKYISALVGEEAAPPPKVEISVKVAGDENRA